MNHFYCRAELGPKGCETEKPEITLAKNSGQNILGERGEKKNLRGKEKKIPRNKARR